MPSPQTLVAFVTGLFVLLLATRVQLGFDPWLAAGLSLLLSLGLAYVVERRMPEFEEEEIRTDAVGEEREDRTDY